MLDIWGFLLQTLNASGIAVLILLIKALFKDKLPPKWHFLVWSVLGILLLIPAGMGGRYTLLRWRVVIEFIKPWFGDYSYTRVLFPFPVLRFMPDSVADWLFIIYLLGVIAFLVKYIISYVGLRHVMKQGLAPNKEIETRIRQIAENHKIKVGEMIEVRNLPSAFICGVFHPVLVIPMGKEVDEKVILHELFHLKYKDTFWNVVICILKCIHWCNPLLNYCAGRAINDMESRCDQYVLEILEGEERREYGNILLSMVNDRFAKTPGCTSINNGGKNIRERIEAIARFKKYPSGMELVSFCAILVLTVSMAVGVQAGSVYDFAGETALALASARSMACTTYGGAFDTYAKAVFDQNGAYRAMCAPESMQEEILKGMMEREESGLYPAFDTGLKEWPKTESGYYIYNITKKAEDQYEGLLVLETNYPPDGKAEEEGKMYLAVQNLRAFKENGRWVVMPLDEFSNVEVMDQSLEWGCMELPGVIYTETAEQFRAEVKMQTIHWVDNFVISDNNFFFGSSTSFDTTPKPNSNFTEARSIQDSRLIHLGTQEERDAIVQVGFPVAAVYPGESRPEHLKRATGGDYGGSSNTGESWNSSTMREGWGPEIEIAGGGGGIDPTGEVEFPEYYAADLYVNNQLLAPMSLYMQEEVRK